MSRADHEFVWTDTVATAGFFRCRICRRSCAAHLIEGTTLDAKDDGTDLVRHDAITMAVEMGFDVFGRPPTRSPE